ncbi:MAG: DUF554 domain-containing protein [Clostridia bacterium]|nr:DUF554 domain-containing protein [Clostridia bacterium]
MPVGIIVNSLAILIGGLIGASSGSRLSAEFKEKLNMVFSIGAMGMGIVSIILMQNLPAVVLSLILGTILGIALRLSARIEKGGRLLQKGLEKMLPGIAGKGTQDNSALLLTTVVLFCASGSGIYGSIVSGISGDHSILIAKSILDLFTAMIFACTLGAVTAAIALPQFCIFMLLFLLAKVIYPLTTPTMISDFKACGGLILLATGLRIAKIKEYPVADMIPAMLLVWPISAAWTAWILPLIG